MKHFQEQKKKNKKIIFFIYIFVFIPSVLAETSEGSGVLTFTYFPNGDVEIEVNGEFYYPEEPSDIRSYIEGLSFSQVINELDTNIYSMNSYITFGFDSQLALFLSNLNLDISAHLKNLNSEIFVNSTVPGVASVEGIIRMNLEEESYQGSLETELSATLWYSLLPREEIEMMMDNKESLISEFESWVNELSDGKLEVQELIVDGEIRPISTLLTISAVISGEWDEGFTDLKDIVTSEYDEHSFLNSDISPDNHLSIQSSDIWITFQGEELELHIEAKTILEGELNEYVNMVKDEICAEILLDNDIESELKELVEDLIIPTEYKISDLNATISVIDDDRISIKFYSEGFRLIQPNNELLFKYLEKASQEMGELDFTINIVGASSDEEYVEIIVPDSQSDNITGEQSSVSLNFKDADSLDQISFQVKPLENNESEPSETGQNLLLPTIGGVLILVVVVAFYLFNKK
jgi:hypothetical protein